MWKKNKEKTIRDCVNQVEGSKAFQVLSMASSTSFLSPPLAAPHRLHTSASPRHLRPSLRIRPLCAARRRHPDAVVVSPDARPWVGSPSASAPSYRDGGEEEDDDGEEEEEEDDDRSLDLLVRFMQSVFRKVSRRARRAARSVLPPSVPAELVRSAPTHVSSLFQPSLRNRAARPKAGISLDTGPDLMCSCACR
jgi:hypothetical protein